MFFAIAAVVAIGVATVVVNLVIGKAAEDNLITIAEENTARDGEHIQSMMRMMGPTGSMGSMGSPDSMAGMGSPKEGEGPMAMGEMSSDDSAGMHVAPMSLESLVSPGGLPSMYLRLVEGLNIVKLDLFDAAGINVWSTDPGSVGTSKERTGLSQAAAGETSSKLATDLGLVDLSGVSRRLDVVETHMPVLDTPGGNIIGVLGISRDVAKDVALQVDDAKSAVLWTTLATMGGLFFVLFGFVVAADISLYRSRTRELSAVEEANRGLEDRVQQRTQELEEANLRLIEAQDQIVRTEKLAAIGQLAAQLAHDMRNPLAAINNAVFNLKRRLAGSELAQASPRIGQYLDIMGEEVGHSNQIVTDLMGFARVSPPSFSLVNVHEIIEKTLSGIQMNDNINVETRFAPELPNIMADGGQLGQRVFMNLASNAQDAMPDGGELTIATRKVNGYVEVAFSDTGTGIDQEIVGKVFEPLFSTKSRGTGLGLAACQQIVSNHGGTIGVTSVPGEGSTFSVRLPVSQEQS